MDFALEVTLSGSRRKDLEDNVRRFASLGIPEYFVFDRPQRRIHGYRLAQSGASYATIVPQQGRWPSRVLGLDLGVEDNRFRCYVGSAVVPEVGELLERANQLADKLQDRVTDLESLLQQAEQQREHEQQQREHERQQREHAERRVLALEQELARLRNERKG